MTSNDLGQVVRLQAKPGLRLSTIILAALVASGALGWFLAGELLSILPLAFVLGHWKELAGGLIALIVVVMLWQHLRKKPASKLIMSAGAMVIVFLALAVAHGWWAILQDSKHGRGEDAAPPPAITLPESLPAYAALGDSYSAGEGLRPYDAGTEGREDSTNRCHRSSGAYGRRLGLADMIFVACSGSRTSDMIPGSGEPRGTQGYREPQVDDDFPEPRAGLVTITIGGNDLGFSHILTHCINTRSCHRRVFLDTFDDGVASGLTLEQWAPGRIDLVAGRLTMIYEWLRESVPDQTRIVVLGYPNLMPTPTLGIVEDTRGHARPNCALFFGQYSPGEREALIDLEDQFVTMLQDTATAAGLEFIDVRPIFADHEPCGVDPAPWVNFIPAGDKAGSFHPTGLGQAAYAWTVSCYLSDAVNLPACVRQGVAK